MLCKEDKSLVRRTKTNYKYAAELKIENNGNLILYRINGMAIGH